MGIFHETIQPAWGKPGQKPGPLGMNPEIPDVRSGESGIYEVGESAQVGTMGRKNFPACYVGLYAGELESLEMAIGTWIRRFSSPTGRKENPMTRKTRDDSKIAMIETRLYFTINFTLFLGFHGINDFTIFYYLVRLCCILR